MIKETLQSEKLVATRRAAACPGKPTIPAWRASTGATSVRRCGTVMAAGSFGVAKRS
jgi:hypothetical protein